MKKTMKKTMKRNVVLSSIMAIVLCISLIAGGTFALFTSESKVNIAVTSGKVNVVASIDELTLYSPAAIGESAITNETNIATETTFGNGGTATISGNTLTLTNVTPGDKANFNIVIENNSNVKIQYRTVIACDADTGLFEGLAFTIGGASVTGKTAWTLLDAGADIADLACSVELPIGSGNEYQEKTCTISFTVEAVQGNAEMPVEWDGEEPGTEDAPAADPETGVYHISTAAEFITYINTVGGSSANTYTSVEVVLDNDIDLGGYTFERVGESYIFEGKFDGRNHTVSNYNIKRTDSNYYTGLFGYMGNGGSNPNPYIKHLTVKNARVSAPNAGDTGALLAAISNGTVENCHAVNCTVSGLKKVGALVGYAEGSNSLITGCSATDCNVYVGRTAAVDSVPDGADYTAILGLANAGSVINNYTITRCNVMYNTTYYYAEVATAAQLKAAVALNTTVVEVRLLNDITVSSDWTPINYTFYGSENQGVDHLIINGDNYSVIGLPSALVTQVSSGRGKLTVKDLTVKNANINGGTYQNGLGNAAIVAYLENGSVELDNCHVIDSEITDNVTGVAAMIGYISNTVAPSCTIVVKNCSVKNTTVTSSDGNAAGIIGYAQAAITIKDFEYSNLTVSGEEPVKTGYYIGTANVGSVINISGAPADHTGLIGRNYNNSATINYN